MAPKSANNCQICGFRMTSTTEAIGKIKLLKFLICLLRTFISYPFIINFSSAALQVQSQLEEIQLTIEPRSTLSDAALESSTILGILGVLGAILLLMGGCVICYKIKRTR